MLMSRRVAQQRKGMPQRQSPTVPLELELLFCGFHQATPPHRALGVDICDSSPPFGFSRLLLGPREGDSAVPHGLHIGDVPSSSESGATVPCQAWYLAFTGGPYRAMYAAASHSRTVRRQECQRKPDHWTFFQPQMRRRKKMTKDALATAGGGPSAALMHSCRRSSRVCKQKGSRGAQGPWSAKRRGPHCSTGDPQ